MRPLRHQRSPSYSANLSLIISSPLPLDPAFPCHSSVSPSHAPLNLSSASTFAIPSPHAPSRRPRPFIHASPAHDQPRSSSILPRHPSMSSHLIPSVINVTQLVFREQTTSVITATYIFMFMTAVTIASILCSLRHIAALFDTIYCIFLPSIRDVCHCFQQNLLQLFTSRRGLAVLYVRYVHTIVWVPFDKDIEFIVLRSIASRFMCAAGSEEWGMRPLHVQYTQHSGTEHECREQVTYFWKRLKDTNEVETRFSNSTTITALTP